MIFPLLVPSISPMGSAVAGEKSEISIQRNFIMPDVSRTGRKPEPSVWTFFADAIGEAESEEKIISTQLYKSPYIASNYGYALKDQFAIPTERYYLPDEPPNN
ncbi:MAG: hypothetical protein HOH19_08570 [Kordiimonadaceae bacterium]|nr:hypothetical protein [Kordiimonadaceae bacterium]MBT6032615.1 hypothetical protein [Kordiimonadaceae bacterium]